MGSLVGMVLVSAITSAFVTLAVEWVAKPRLKARKKGLLAFHRARRAFEKNLHIILSNASKLATGAAHGIPRGTEEELRRAIRVEADRAASQIVAATKDMSVVLWTTCQLMLRIIFVTSSYGYVFTARVISISTRTGQEGGDTKMRLRAQ
jgi:hypothetical protein